MTKYTRAQLHSTTTRKVVLKHLSDNHLRMLDEAIEMVGDFGEIHIVIAKGRLRFLNIEKSYDALKYQPGTMIREA